ncbi:pectate lyase [Aestuariivivens sediminicola]|uniref:pectate lyase n=1 Tax=Aestuariivivens sediminicola TaxID=2913560 RepID=UPI001F57F97F|nr:pectate lyase [Aestuariivivens sediminicola]
MRFYLFIIISVISVHFEAQVLDTSWRTIVTRGEDAWFASKEAQVIADNVLLYQRDVGGWPKNIQMHKPLSQKEKETLKALKKRPEGCTTDNGATVQEMLFLSKVYRQVPRENYRIAFLKGLNYILEAQYDNGGWPQFYPLRKGYYSHITYNDDNMVNILKLLKEINDNSGYYSIRPSLSILNRTRNAFNKGIDCVLKTQYKQNGVLTAWCAQYDQLKLQPAGARSYELPSLSGKESAQIVLLLMSIEDPSDAVINAINHAVKWFEDVKITGIDVKLKRHQGRIVHKEVVVDKTAPPLWARFMELDDNTPFFCDRDGIKRSSLAEIGDERRNGYAWYTREPQILLDEYPKWKMKILPAGEMQPKAHHDVVVSKDGTGDYSNIQEAINHTKAFPYDKVTIFVKNGIYYEKVKIHEWNSNIILIGESKEHTKIIYDDHFNKIALGRNSTFYTYTLMVEANNVVLKNLTIENSSGEVGQAVALSMISDQVAVINCNLLGHQDTLYTSGKGKQYYQDCYIEGTTDFIFGSATAYFENCRIHSKKDSYITAASTPRESRYGYVFNNCRLTAEEGVAKVYLGRPWRIYAQTVFMNCELGAHILPAGWHNWSKSEAEKTAFYAEYKNYGQGSKPDARVSWSKQLSERESELFSKKAVLGNNNNNLKREWYENVL